MKYKFIKNEDLLTEIKKFNETEIISQKLHLLLYNLANNISARGNWAGYTWRSDMVSDAYLKCLSSLKKFDVERSQKPFSFFTTVIFRYYIDYIKKFKKHKIVIEKLENEFKNKMNIKYGIRYENFKSEKNV